jgi:CRISPR-associated protein Csc1
VKVKKHDAPVVYRCTLELMDFLFFATTERGKTFETGAFVHNYALTYALAAAGAFSLLHSPPYGHDVQQPAYDRELMPLNNEGLYVTPAQPVRLMFRQTQFNTIREGYAFAGKARSIAYPDWGFLRLISPSSRFEFFVLSADEVQRCAYVRLGKFLSKARVLWERAKDVQPRKGKFQFDGYLNWLDIGRPKPTLFDILPAALPSKLIGNAHFEDAPHWWVRFGEGSVSLPVNLRYQPQVQAPRRSTRRGRKRP